MNRDIAISEARAHLSSGAFVRNLARRVAVRSESQKADSGDTLVAYLIEEMCPDLEAMGFDHRLIENPIAPTAPVLFASRIEDPALDTILIYGHGDVLLGMEGEWAGERSPWRLDEQDGRFYGRGTADNKGQHSINLAALAVVLRLRGHLGFNVKVLIEMGEEIGSPGLDEICATHRKELSADVLIASDGPRIANDKPTIFLGSRGAQNFDIICDLRPSAHHSGNWGGLLADPVLLLAQALATITTPQGKILVSAWLPSDVPASVRAAVAQLALAPSAGDPEIDPTWGEPGMSGPEKLYMWSSFAVLAIEAGNLAAPVNAIAGLARAHCQLRFPVGVDSTEILPALRTHLDSEGFSMITLEAAKKGAFDATRTDPDNPWVKRVAASIAATMGSAPAVLPSLGGSLPNGVFAETLAMPTIWIPHSHPSCAQHAPDEHMLVRVADDGLAMMAGLFWDLGEG